MFRLVQSFFIPPVREIFPKDLYISWQHFVVLKKNTYSPVTNRASGVLRSSILFYFH
jgi:hypothetical protein